MGNVELYGYNRISLNPEVKPMPNIESAIKRVRTSEAANAKNSSQMSAMRTTVKKVSKVPRLHLLSESKMFTLKLF